MPKDKTLIIGSGMTGLSCARRLVEAGLDVAILDKGRGVGGRLATRRVDGGWALDHGAQYVTARDPAFQAAMEEMRAAETAAIWDDGSSEPHFVGTPGMSALAKHLGAGLDIRQNSLVVAIEQTADGWTVVTESGREEATRVAVTAPAPQVPLLIGPDHPLAQRIAPVDIAPCWTLMAVVRGDRAAPFVHRRAPEDVLSWIAHNSAKPNRPGPGCWVAQASARWSAEHLELERDEVAERLLPLLLQRIGADPGAVSYVAAHRWRYANVTNPLGEPFLRDETETLYLGGDWCVGPRVEAAWLSGRAIADDILSRL